MLMRRLKGKLIFPSVIILFFLVVIMTVNSTIEFYRFSSILNNRNVKTISNNLELYLKEYEHNSRAAAVSVSRFPEIIRAVNERSTERLIETLTPLLDLFNVTYFTIIDINGIVLARTHEPSRFGDSIAEMQSFIDAMDGKVSTFYEAGSIIRVSVHTGSPIYNANGSLIGVISAGVRLDENESADKLKERFSAEFSIFSGNSRVATTLIENGERLTGTKLDFDISQIIKDNKNEYFESFDSLKKTYSTFLHPIFNSKNEAFAAIVVGVSNEEMIQERNRLILYNFIIGLAGLIVAIFILMQIIARIVKPVNNLVKMVSSVTQGNLNINIDRVHLEESEIDILSSDVYSLIEVIKSMLDDLSRLIIELNESGDIEYQIDTGKYNGSYKEIIESINKLCNSISMKNKTMATMDHLDTMIYVADFNYNILYLNQSIINAYNINKDNYLNQKCYKAIKNLDEPCEHCKMHALLENKDMYPSSEYEYRQDDYIKKWIGGRSVIMPWVDGSRVLYNYFNDEMQVKDFEEKLREAANKAQAASVAKSIFLANMSHEIRTPMNSIMGFSELALDDIIPERTREYLFKILDNTKGLLQIVNDILDISKVESGKMELENIPFALHDLFSSCRAMILPAAVEKGIMLYFYAEPSLGKMPLGDPTRLKQVLINLLSNAVKFTNTGTIKVLSEIKAKTEKTVTVYFEVKDSGIGMTSEQIEKIFDPFIQGESGTTRKYGGTGLGLTITKSIVELMGGDLNVESTPGVGSKFSFTLIFNTIDVTKEKIYQQQWSLNIFDKPEFQGEVLLCEDNAMNQQVISEHLARVGLKTVVAWNGRIGYDKVRERSLSGEKQFDLILMDMHMPVMDGLEASAKIMELNTGIPMIAMTANVMSDDRDIYKASGLEDCVGKPFTSQELWSCLLKYLIPVNTGVKTIKDDNNVIESDNNFQKSLRSLFVRSNKTKYNDIIKALEADDIKLAHRLAHSLKTNAGQIGKTMLQNAAADIERQLKEGKKDIAEEQLKILETELKTVLVELAPLAEEAEKAGMISKDEFLDHDDAKKLIKDIEPFLNTGNPECLKYIDEIYRFPGDEVLKTRLIQQIDDFEFEKAVITFKELTEYFDQN